MVRVSIENSQNWFLALLEWQILKTRNEKLLKLCVSTESNSLTFPHLSSSSTVHLVRFGIVKSNCNKINQTKRNNMPCLCEFTFVISAYAPVEDYLHLNVCGCCKNAERQAP